MSKTYTGNPPEDGHLLGQVGGYDIYQRQTVEGWTRIKACARPGTRARKANFNLGWNGVEFAPWRDQEIVEQNYPELLRNIETLLYGLVP